MLLFTFRPWSIRKSQPNKISLSNGVHTTRKKWTFSVNDSGSIRGGGGGGGGARGVEEEEGQGAWISDPVNILR